MVTCVWESVSVCVWFFSFPMPDNFSVKQVFETDISKQLQAYEVEYHVLQEELIDSSPLSDNQRMDKLEKTNSSLRKQNLDLLEQLQVGHVYKAATWASSMWWFINSPDARRLSFPPLEALSALFVVGIKGGPGELFLFVREQTGYPLLRSDCPETFWETVSTLTLSGGVPRTELGSTALWCY